MLNNIIGKYKEGRQFGKWMKDPYNPLIQDETYLILSKGLESRPDDFIALMRLASVCSYKRGGHSFSVELARKALKIRSDNLEVQLFIADSLYWWGRTISDDQKYYQALEEYDNFLKKNPNSVHALLKRADCLIQLKKYWTAVKHLENIKKKDVPINYKPYLWKLLGEAYKEVGMRKTALKCYKEAVKTHREKLEKENLHSLSMSDPLGSNFGQRFEASIEMERLKLQGEELNINPENTDKEPFKMY